MKGRTMNSRNKRILGIALLLLAIGVVAYAVQSYDPGEYEKVSGEPSTVSGQHTAGIVIEEGGAFSPASLSVKTNTAVTWVSNDDDNNHVLQAGPHPGHSSLPDLKSPILGANQSYTYVFKKPGTYTYHDEINPELGGTVIVNN